MVRPLATLCRTTRPRRSFVALYPGNQRGIISLYLALYHCTIFDICRTIPRHHVFLGTHLLHYNPPINGVCSINGVLLPRYTQVISGVHGIGRVNGIDGVLMGYYFRLMAHYIKMILVTFRTISSRSPPFLKILST